MRADVTRGSKGKSLILMGVLAWHAGVGVVCLSRGRAGFESLLQPLVTWPVSTMLGLALGVTITLSPFGKGDLAPLSQCLGWLVALLYSMSTCVGWGWLFVARRADAYDVIAAFFSRGFGGAVDAETGSGFAGFPLWAGLHAVSLLGYAAFVEHHRQAHGAARTTRPLRALIALLFVAGLGAVVHFANGTRVWT